MQVTQVAAEGLVRQFRIVVPAEEIESRVASRLEDLKARVRMPGFRPGKVPLPLLRKQYGKGVLGEVVEQAVDEGTKKAIGEHELKPALRPEIEITSFDEGKDLEFAVRVELLPEVPPIDLKAIELTRPVAAVDDAMVAETIERIARARQKFRAPAEPRPATKGDKVTIDFEGRIDGQPFEGGSGRDLSVVLGAGGTIPGFEDQLEGVVPGERRTIRVTFPENYGDAKLRGKEATFEIVVKAVEEPLPITIDDALAKEVGAEDLADLQKEVRERIEADFKTASRLKAKRRLLDRLAADYVFAVPKGMVDIEFDAIWREVEREMKERGLTFEAEGKSEEELKAEYRAIAERRVRLGLILSEIGTRHEIKVEGHELQQAVIAQAQRYPGREREVIDFYRSNAGALEALRAPIFEDKVVDFVLQLAKVTDQPVTPAELMREEDEEETPASGASAAEAKAAS
ncbi:MAG: trigger factor [Geminicoccaceae bacterium]|nr:trigger factor [Geminicoccaceae bacterium]MCX8099658.1 trigger factor [Geminicoccaceae bacterium]MDW8371626.1 trigger factor [Geminicoccaceae bacterium]